MRKSKTSFPIAETQAEAVWFLSLAMRDLDFQDHIDLLIEKTFRAWEVGPGPRTDAIRERCEQLTTSGLVYWVMIKARPGSDKSAIACTIIAERAEERRQSVLDYLKENARADQIALKH